MQYNCTLWKDTVGIALCVWKSLDLLVKKIYRLTVCFNDLVLFVQLGRLFEAQITLGIAQWLTQLSLTAAPDDFICDTECGSEENLLNEFQTSPSGPGLQ